MSIPEVYNKNNIVLLTYIDSVGLFFCPFWIRYGDYNSVGNNENLLALDNYTNMHFPMRLMTKSIFYGRGVDRRI